MWVNSSGRQRLKPPTGALVFSPGRCGRRSRSASPGKTSSRRTSPLGALVPFPTPLVPFPVGEFRFASGNKHKGLRIVACLALFPSDPAGPVGRRPGPVGLGRPVILWGTGNPRQHDCRSAGFITCLVSEALENESHQLERALAPHTGLGILIRRIPGLESGFAGFSALG